MKKQTLRLAVARLLFWAIPAVLFGTNHAPTPPLSYCTPGFVTACDNLSISGVVLGSISNTGTGCTGYSDYFGSFSTAVTAGQSYTITLTNGGTVSGFFSVYFDADLDMDFGGASEKLVDNLFIGAGQTVSTPMTIPGAAVGGDQRMRIVTGVFDADDPCFSDYGEVEDYKLVTAPNCDADGDGFQKTACGGNDCNDADPIEHPGQTWYIDADADGYGGSTVMQCARPVNGFILAELQGSGDCDDADNQRYPGNPEYCDNKDNDCNGLDDDVPTCGATGERTWTGTIGAAWATPCNWDPPCAPTAADDATITDVANEPIITTARTLHSLRVEANGFLQINSGGSLAASGPIVNNGSMVNNAGAGFSHSGGYGGSGDFSGSPFSIGSGETLSPGDPNVNEISCTGFSQGLTINGTFAIQVAGLEACYLHDRATAGGMVALGSSSKLVMTVLGAPNFMTGNTVTILSGTARTGTFSMTTLAPNWFVNYTPTEVILSFGIALPIELAGFSAKKSGDGVRLDWRTLSESDNLGFEVERGGDGLFFEKIGFSPGHGTTTQQHSYAFLDENPLAGTNFYRLRQMDTGGLTGGLSPIVSIDMAPEASGGLIAFPNPVAGGRVNLLFPENSADEPIWLRLFDAAGRLVLETTATGGSGFLETMGIAPGPYSLEALTESGVFRKRLVVGE